MAKESDGACDSNDNSAANGEATSPQPIIYRSEELLQGTREVWIEHGADMYRLRVTKSGKLYLTK